MKEMVDKATKRAIAFNADGATQTFYDRLEQRKLQSTRCRACQTVPFPPRMFCPSCGCEDVEWIDLPARGTLYAFTTQHRSLRFMAPDVLGLVELPGVGLVFSKIDAKLDDLEIGQEVEVDFFEVSGDLVVHQFRPV